MTTRRKLTTEEIENSLSRLDGWNAEDKFLRKSFKFENFAEALEFVNRVGAVAESADHHPDIKFGWGYADIELTTHDTGGLTHNDFDVAKAIDGIEVKHIGT
jgi:4a-hydroxytetrahydrobiopterin dehydratase